MKWLLVVAVMASSLSLVGQAPAKPASTEPAPAVQDPGKDDRDRIDQRAQSMRDQIVSGRAVQSHVRVAVRLKNGNKLVGVVKDGKLVERVDGLRFVEATAQDRGAGIRLWYTGGTRNYVFVPFGDFAEYEVLQRLSNKQILAIEQDMQMEERRASERAAASRAAAAEAQPAPGAMPPATETPAPNGATPGAMDGMVVAPPPKLGKEGDKKGDKNADKAKGEAATAAKSEQDQQRLWYALLQDYPPAGGWNKKKRDEISRRFVVIGAKPSATEQRFVERYDDWLKGCAHFGINPEAKPAESSEEVDADARPSRRRK